MNPHRLEPRRVDQSDSRSASCRADNPIRQLHPIPPPHPSSSSRTHRDTPHSPHSPHGSILAKPNPIHPLPAHLALVVIFLLCPLGRFPARRSGQELSHRQCAFPSCACLHSELSIRAIRSIRYICSIGYIRSIRYVGYVSCAGAITTLRWSDRGPPS